jgi:hypothetical protein
MALTEKGILGLCRTFMAFWPCVIQIFISGTNNQPERGGGGGGSSTPL